MGVWGRSSQEGPGAEPLVEVESLLALKCSQEGDISRLIQVNEETHRLFTHLHCTVDCDHVVVAIIDLG